jgi:ATP-dependent protease ClpP protease subunit
MRDISVELDSPGGSLVEGLEIAEVLRSRSEIVSAQVGSSERPNAECASACVLAYLGADLRYLAENGRIGVHQFGDPSGTVAADAAINIAQRFASEIVSLLDRQRVSTELFSRMSNTPPDQITWVEKADLTRWRVVTGPIFDERMEYKNANGKVALHMVQESLYGTNQMTLICGDDLVAYAVLEEPELAMLGWFSLVIDGEDNRISDTELLNRDNARTRFLMRVPDHISAKMISAKSIGARVHTPGGNVFWGFDQTIRDSRVREMAESCTATTSGARRMHILPATDLIGNDLTQNGFRGISFQECQRICLDAPTCQAVSYVSEKQWCWPKGAAGQQEAAPGIISAVK